MPFESGRSGNPKGRPKGALSIAAMLYKILHQKIELSEGDKIRKRPVLDVVLRRLANNALKGDSRSLKDLLSIAMHHEGSLSVEPRNADVAAEDLQILDRYLGKSGNDDAV